VETWVYPSKRPPKLSCLLGSYYPPRPIPPVPDTTMRPILASLPGSVRLWPPQCFHFFLYIGMDLNRTTFVNAHCSFPLSYGDRVVVFWLREMEARLPVAAIPLSFDVTTIANTSMYIYMIHKWKESRRSMSSSETGATLVTI
jgi:hypothetical protein